MNNPWDVRPAASIGDADPQLLFASIGAALTEWAHVETACAEIYAILVSAKGRYPFQTAVVRAYGSLSNFSTQCQLIEVAAEAFFHKKSKKTHLSGRLRKLLRSTRNYAPRRNEIAHGQVSQVYTQQLKKIGHFLLPALYNSKKYKLLEQEITYQYCSSDIIYYRQEFTKLHLHLSAFHNELKS